MNHDAFEVFFDIKELENGNCYIGVRTKDKVLKDLLEDGVFAENIDCAIMAIEKMKNNIVRITSSSGPPTYRTV